MVNSERVAADQASEPYFVLAAWRPELATGGDCASAVTRGECERFLSDWARRCLPLPLCSATSQHAFNAYQLWARLQGVDQPAPITDFVVLACAAGFGKSRHTVNLHGATTVAQHVVLHPQGAGSVKTGAQLDRAVSAFAMSLAGWRLAAGGPAATVATHTDQGQG